MSCCCLWFSLKPTDQTPLALQLVSGSYLWFQFEPTGQTLSSVECELILFLAPFQGCWLSLLLGSAVCKLVLSLALFQGCWPSPPLPLQVVNSCCLWHPFKAADQAHSWLCRQWVVAVSGMLSSLLTKPTFGSAGSELLLSLAPFQACWPSSLLALQEVSYCYSWHPFKLADQAHPWLCSWWVGAVPGTLSSLLTKLTLGSVAGELMTSLTPLQACWSSHPWLCRRWVAAVSGTLSSLLTKPTLGSVDSELLLSLGPFQACWSSSPLAPQEVSCCCSWCWFLLTEICSPLALQAVSCCNFWLTC